MTMPADYAELPHARDAVRDALDGQIASEWPLTMVVTELLANAIAVTPDDANVEVAVACLDDDIEVRVSDPGPGFDREVLERFVGRPPAATQRRGRGLYLVQQCSRDLRVDRVNGRTVVSARVPRRNGRS